MQPVSYAFTPCLLSFLVFQTEEMIQRLERILSTPVEEQLYLREVILPEVSREQKRSKIEKIVVDILNELYVSETDKHNLGHVVFTIINFLNGE